MSSAETSAQDAGLQDVGLQDVGPQDVGSAEDGAPDSYRPLDDRTQPVPVIAGYIETARRTPRRNPVQRPTTLSDLVGPRQFGGKLPLGSGDLYETKQGHPALGVRIHVEGRVLDEEGRGVPGAVLEIWQANAAGRYRYDASGFGAIDPNFAGYGRIQADAEGRYSFVTLKPGAYPVYSNPGRWWRPPHIHLSIFGAGMASRLITQVYFPGEPLNGRDIILNAIPDAAARERLVMREMPILDVPAENTLGFRQDFVLRGRHATPFEEQHSGGSGTAAGGHAGD
ncbi:protocatechuate 3,4-dioxygenase subunit beta [Marinibaculum pumilum]|uniref:Protocatechuate 3,4-dioxygenase subunit beta n=1 Tax=Marinibaculum pumilum TaxID=1766165 RepID=A0ABV7L3Q9_9PROT